jgi:hypothetical protein
MPIALQIGNGGKPEIADPIAMLVKMLTRTLQICPQIGRRKHLQYHYYSFDVYVCSLTLAFTSCYRPDTNSFVM